MKCVAETYGDCTSYGKKEEIEINFLYRDKYGNHKPDTKVNVCFCEAHLAVLKKMHGNTINMRGETVEWALHDDLLYSFDSKNRFMTLVKVTKEEESESKEEDFEDSEDSEDSEDIIEKYCLFKGRGTNSFKEFMFKNDRKISRITEEAYFLWDYNVEKDCQEVIEMRDVTSEIEILSIKNLSEYYEKVPDKLVPYNNNADVLTLQSVELEYVKKPLCEYITNYFTEKLNNFHRESFNNSIDFIIDKIDHNIIDWNNLRKISNHSEDEVLFLVRQLFDSLVNNDNDVIENMKQLGQITEIISFKYSRTRFAKKYYSD